ncbi:hypothetical protein DSCA_35930 [Desulfosarcina alkanivorans]|jgi:uncharacterized membrane protein (GlpM family)|uniref:DUF3147 family protein n=1 Tax=Desulfosarcina alkanivorans TaxID=571177 RepID=A0A5K7YMK3_9BACT|nr:hypothetical protein [Desulfosarcina alkanivorans]BBO69663.1 hypothetical protein DSCA_35930 [Desulfosarcina alkanivorans]
MIELSLFTVVKVSVSILVVVLLSLIAEWASPRIAGIVSGYPLGAAISLYFIGLENGNRFAARSALFTAAGLAATIAFVGGYLLGIRWAHGRGRLRSLAFSVLPGIAAYGLAAWTLSYLPVNWISAPSIAITGMLLAAWGFRRIPNVKIRQKIRLGISVTLLRAVFAALVILAITTVAGAVGPRWAGLFSAFPITMLPLLVIVQFTYETDHVRTIIKNVPRGLGSLLIYALVVAAFYTRLGIAWGTLLGYLAATIYLIMLEYGIKACGPRGKKCT